MKTAYTKGTAVAFNSGYWQPQVNLMAGSDGLVRFGELSGLLAQEHAQVGGVFLHMAQRV